MKIQLVQALSENKNLMNDKWITPLNLIALGTYLNNFSYDVEILDGVHLSLEEILNKIDGNIVGINFNIFSTSVMDSIAEYAKYQGSLVVVGGAAATSLAKPLLNGNKNIDLVVRFDGEEALRLIANKAAKSSNNFEGIPNIVYRKSGEIFEERVEKLDIKTLSIPNRRIKGIDIEKYIASLPREIDSPKDVLIRSTNTYTKKGCDRVCSFCARVDKEIRTRTPEQVFEEDKQLAEEFGIRYIFEMSDTYFADISWLKRFRDVYKKNKGLPVKYWAFCDIRDINTETVKIMKDLNVDGVCVGIESGSEEIRRKNGKNFTNEEIYKAAGLLGRAGIKLEDSYILGLIGENEKTVKETYQLSDKVAQLCKTYRTGYTLVLPLPGSGIWKKMMQVPKLKLKYGQEYRFNIEELRKDFISHFCDL